MIIAIRILIFSALLLATSMRDHCSAEEEDGSEVISLFNGRNLEGFYTWLRTTEFADPQKVFSVDEGSIRISGAEDGYLATKSEFSNYRLDLEFRWGRQKGLDRGARAGHALDSGVFLHASGPDGNSHDGDGAFMAAIEVNVFQGATGDVLLIRGDDIGGRLIVPRVQFDATEERDGEGFRWWSKSGDRRKLSKWGRVNWKLKDENWKNQRDFRGKSDVEREYGLWNQLSCVCQDGTISVFLNGMKVNEVTNVFPQRGKILLQSEGAEIFFRKLRLTRIRERNQ